MEKEINELKRKIQALDNQYYETGDSPVNDKHYDALVKRLKQLEMVNGEDTEGTVGYSTNGLNNVEHKLPMLSLSSIYTDKELEAFFARALTNMDTNDGFIAEPKYDGLAVNLTYLKGQLVSASTRGDGLMGENILPNVMEISSIPKQIAINKGVVEIRGEVYCDRQTFNEVNRAASVNGKPTFATPRSLAVGTLRHLNPKLSSERLLRFTPYGVGHNTTDEFRRQTTHKGLLEMFRRLGFVYIHYKEISSLEDFKTFFNEMTHMASGKYPTHTEEATLPMDGVVVKANSLLAQTLMGVGTKYPHWAVAYKFENATAVGVVDGVEWNVSRQGNLIPVLQLTPTIINGVKIRKASLHNTMHYVQFGGTISVPRMGDQVVVEMAGGVIPKVSGWVKRSEDGELLHIPLHCPSCGGLLSMEKTHHRCTAGALCPAQLESYILHVASRDALDIKRFGKAILNQLMDTGLLNRGLISLFSLTPERLIEKGFPDSKITQQLIQSINDARATTLKRFLIALGIPQCGKIVAEQLAIHFVKGDAIWNASLQDFAAAGIKPAVASEIYCWLQKSQNRQLIETLTKPIASGGCGITWTEINTQGIKTTPLSGITYAFVGSLESISRDDAKSIIKALGGEVSKGVSREVDIVVAGFEANTQHAVSLGIDVWDEGRFIDMVKCYRG